MKYFIPNTPAVRVLLYGKNATRLKSFIAAHPNLQVVKEDPDVVISYGGDGTLLHSELQWPGIPKVPILNSMRGHRCIPHPPDQVFECLANGSLIRNEYSKIVCRVFRDGVCQFTLSALNEINVQMGRINSAVRFKLWLNGKPYENGLEYLGDGFLIATPFGSTAYFASLTRATFIEGIGIAFKASKEHIDHLVVPERFLVRFLITRGPAVMAHDACQEYKKLEEGDEIEVARHKQSGIILTCDPVHRLNEPF